jgi:hypothetical protein
MAAPLNLSALTATPLGPLPATVTQTVDDAGVTYPVWYSFLAPTNGEVSVWAHGAYGGTAYLARADIWVDPPSAPVSLFDGMLTADDAPMHFPVTNGTRYFIKIAPTVGNPTPAVLTLTVQMHTPATAGIGSIVVPDDTPLLPLALARPDLNATVSRFVRAPTAAGFPSGEAGDVLPDGTCLISWSTIQSGSPYGADLYDRNFAHIATVFAGIKVRYITSNLAGAFYVLLNPGAGQPNALRIQVKRVSATGVVSPTTWDLGLSPGLNVYAIAVNAAETILYYLLPGGAGSGHIKRWDLVANVALSDLTAGTFATSDLLCLQDGSVLVPSGAGVNTNVLRYSAAGALLNTYVFAAPGASRVARGGDDLTSVWFWNKGEVPCIFTRVRVSDGVVLGSVRHGLYNSGIWWDGNGPLSVAAVEGAIFGVSESCPFWIARTPYPTVTTGTIRVAKVSDLPGDTTSFFFTATGLTPSTFALRAGDSVVFEVPVGSAYAVHEVPQQGWMSEAVVSNGTLDAIVVVANIETTVVFTNTPTLFGPGFSVSSRAIRRVRQAPHLTDENRRIQYHEFWLDCQVGIGLPISQGSGRDPLMTLDWSDDNAETWSREYPLPLGVLGQYHETLRWWRLGQSRDRVFRVTVSEPVDVALIDTYLSISKGLS